MLQKKRRASRGMSLVECVVALAVLGIFSLLIFLVFGVALRQYRQADVIDKNTDENAAVLEVSTPSGGDSKELKYNFGGTPITVQAKEWKVDTDGVELRYYHPVPTP